DAAARVADGDRVAVGGCLFSRTPLALVREILRTRRRRLTLVRNLMCTEGEFMMAAGAVERVMTAWMSIGLPWGVSKVMRHFVESGAVALEEWSHLALGLRFRAAAMGVPFVPALTMLGSDLVAVGGMKTIADPYSGETLAAVPALFPDVALLHVHRADRFGNCQIDGYPHMDADIARAAATVLVTTEELITDEETRRHPDRTVIPGFLVDALVHVPFGSFPHECYGLYEADFDHFAEYTASIDARGPEAAVGVPLLAAALAQQRHAPKLTMVIEGGIIGPRIKPGRLPISTNEMRAAHRAQMLPGITDTFLFAQRGFLDYGFMGGAQIDQHGNVNTSVLGSDYWKPKVRLPGTGGANDIASLCREVIILTAHEKRRFVARVDFVTSPAWLDGGDSRRRAGLPFGGVSRVVTTLGVFGFDPETRRMRLDALHPGVTREQVREQTGFPLLEAPEIPVTEPPAADELAMLRALDPE